MIEHFHKFKQSLMLESGREENPILKIQVSEKVWNRMLSKHSSELNWVEDDTQIVELLFCGIEIVCDRG